LARIEKYHTGIKKVIQHNIREFNGGRCPTNLEVNPDKIKDNYSLIRRGNNSKEIEAYRKKLHLNVSIINAKISYSQMK